MANGAPVLWHGVEVEDSHVSDLDHLWSYTTYLGTEAALRSAGILGPDDRLPRKPRGTIDREGYKITMLVDGSLRVRLGAPLGARRDSALQRLLADAALVAECVAMNKAERRNRKAS